MVNEEEFILVTGGAGYIGSVVVSNLIKNGFSVIVIDDLRDGRRGSIPKGVRFFENNFSNKTVLEEIFYNYKINTVMHFAASANVPLSVKNPALYYYNNISCTLRLLDLMLKHKTDKIIFSSTAAVYGEPQYTPIDEDHPLSPINPYGRSKLMVEEILKDYSIAYNLKFITLRYFCAAGATDDNGESRKSKETHLIPLVVDKIIQPDNDLLIFGNDYDTKDGFGIRDFVHVSDIASAHISALNNIDKFPSSVYNIGSKKGYSILEVVKKAESIFKTNINYIITKRRDGDPAKLTANFDLINRDLGWKPLYNLEKMLKTAMNWRKNPKY